MKRFGSQFTGIGEIAELRFGIKSGCDAFFMPHDISKLTLETLTNDASFKRRYGADRSLVEAGSLKIVKAGDGSEHPIEAEYLAPEVHTLRDCLKGMIHRSDCARVILLVNKSI